MIADVQPVIIVRPCGKEARSLTPPKNAGLVWIGVPMCTVSILGAGHHLSMLHG
jgi:hypothetical protein